MLLQQFQSSAVCIQEEPKHRDSSTNDLDDLYRIIDDRQSAVLAVVDLSVVFKIIEQDNSV